MALRINQNIAAMNAYRNLSVTDGQLTKSLEKLSSGLRINRAADDASGLSVSEGLRSQVSGLKMAVRNAQDGISVIQTAEGGLTETHSILQRMRELAVQAANTGANDTAARDAAELEVTELANELTRISDTTRYGSTKLLNGSYTGTFQIGANAGESLVVSQTQDFDAAGLAVSGLDFTAVGGASAALASIDAAITVVSTARATLGAVQNRLEHAIANLSVAAENLAASESRIRDADMAEEMVAFTRHQILSQAGTSMLAQASSQPQSVLALLRG